jgi:hypothetical protein
MESLGSAGKSQAPAMLGFLLERGTYGLLRHDVREASLIVEIAAQAFPGDAFNRKLIVEVIGVLVPPLRCIRPHLSTLDRVNTRMG